jgi:type II secretory pathway pseudopilin PulG
MLKHRGGLCRRVLLGKSVGFSLVEMVIAIALLAITVGGVLMAMTVVFKQEARQDQERTAEYLTRSEFEYIKSQPYSWGNDTGNGTRSGYPPQYLTLQNTQNYGLDVAAIPIGNSSNPNRDCCGSPCYQPLPYQPLCILQDPSGNLYVNDEGIQEITISVYSYKKTSGSAPVLVTTDYKVARWEAQ